MKNGERERLCVNRDSIFAIYFFRNSGSLCLDKYIGPCGGGGKDICLG
jgi:hypothetical protein